MTRGILCPGRPFFRRGTGHLRLSRGQRLARITLRAAARYFSASALVDGAPEEIRDRFMDRAIHRGSRFERLSEALQDALA